MGGLFPRDEVDPPRQAVVARDFRKLAFGAEHIIGDRIALLPGLEYPAKWIPVRVKKVRKNKKLEPRSDSIGSEKAPEFIAFCRVIHGGAFS
ncbi:hypothetical protein [uncultured Rhodoblastus sp.]|uniref:hypothetical protein n=1 Tax=uncultured Rhodoblastus sp. TaxID=543037 RepID=UPI0025F19B91|nr:hypothetical protein [uncultured Rhodoblastus sp.]